MRDLVRLREYASPADQLRLLLSLPEACPVFATSSFRPWLGPSESPAWPPTSGEGGLVLVDTRDRLGREWLWKWRNGRERSALDAALVLSGSGAPGTVVRRLLRRLRRRGTMRWPEARVVARLPHAAAVTRLSFVDGFHLPDEFALDRDSQSTGAAFLLTRKPPFDGPLWTLLRDSIGGPAVQLLRFQLRIRGAAVLVVRARGRQYVFRIVPEGRLQDIVLRNHSALIGLRQALNGTTSLLDLVPEPTVIDWLGSVAVLGETCLPGTLAWKVASGALARPIHRNAVSFLEALKAATARHGPVGSDTMARLLAPDFQRLEEARFADAALRSRLAEELRSAAEALTGIGMPLHASHGDYGYGNILVDENSGALTGVIDWDTARPIDLPGIDRVNLELQVARTALGGDFAGAVTAVWRNQAAHEALAGPGGPTRIRALFRLGVCRYILRSLRYPSVYARDAAHFDKALVTLQQLEDRH